MSNICNFVYTEPKLFSKYTLKEVQLVIGTAS